MTRSLMKINWQFNSVLGDWAILVWPWIGSVIFHSRRGIWNRIWNRMLTSRLSKNSQYIYVYSQYRSGTVLFSLTAAVVSIELTLTDKGVQLNSFQVIWVFIYSRRQPCTNRLLVLHFCSMVIFQGGISPIIQDILSKTIPLCDLQSLLEKSGINLFPDEDAFCYCESIYLG